MLVSYLASGVAISIAVSLVAGIAVGSTMGIAGFGSIWVFRAEMLSMFVGCTAVLLAQFVLIVETVDRLSLKAGVVAGGCFFFVDPVAGLVAVGTAIAVAFLVGSITGKWKAF